MYTSNYTSKKDLKTARNMGVIVNLDDVSLVKHMNDACGGCNDLMCFRLNPGIGRTDSETKSNVLGGPCAKFGVPPEDIVSAYQQAKDGGATRFGWPWAVLSVCCIHLHFGRFFNMGSGLSQQIDPCYRPWR